jgi:hypothetical protein
MTGGAAFYCVCSGIYFLGAVGLINSLRLLGHSEPIFVLDRGLSPVQRQLLAPHATVVAAPEDAEPFMLKTYLPARHPAEVMVLIDADMIVTRSLTEPIKIALDGRVVAVEHPHDRYFDEWGELLGLGSTRRHPYLSSGLVFLGGPIGRQVIHLMDGAQGVVDFERTQFRTDFPDYPFIAGAPSTTAEYPFFFADQDLLNAAVAARVPPECVVALDQRLAPLPPFDGVKVVDEQAVRCALDDGTVPYVLHHYLAKPWLELTHHGPYSRLLRRLLVGPRLAVRVPEADLPLRFRTGSLAYIERKRVNARERFRYHVAEPLSSRLRGLRGRPGTEQ